MEFLRTKGEANMSAQLVRRTVSVLSVALLCAAPVFAIVTWAPLQGSAYDGGSLQSAFDVPTATLASTKAAEKTDLSNSDVVVAEQQQWEDTAANRNALRARIRAQILAKIARFSGSAH